MEIELTHPGLLWALLGLGLLVWAHRGTLAPFSARRRRLSLVLRCAVLILVVLALVDPRWMRQRRETHVIWLVDLSRSVGGAAMEALKKLTTQPTGAKSESWIGFAGRSALVKDASGL